MTDEEKQREVGLSLEGYKRTTEQLGALLSKLNRIYKMLEGIRKVVESENLPDNIASVSHAAIQQMGDDGDVLKLLREIQSTSSEKARHRQDLYQQGYGRYIKD